MNHKTQFIFLILLGSLAVCSCRQKKAQEKPLKPNFIFLLADDQRYNTISKLGNEEVITPTLDSLCAAGVTFLNAHINGAMNAAVCAPSRAMLNAGRGVFQIEPSGEDIKPEHITLPELLKQNGYNTFHTGKWHNGRKAFARSFSHGNNIFFGGMSDHYKVPLYAFDSTGVYPSTKSYSITKHSTEIYTDAAVEFIQNYDSNKPFYMNVAFQAPHDPKQVPLEFTKMYHPDKIKLPENYLPQHPFNNGELEVRDEWLTDVPRDSMEIKAHIAAYYGLISHIDVQIQRIFKALKESGKAENTYIIYAADNGLALGQHGLMGKQNLYDHSIRVPLIITGVGIPANSRHATLCYLTDIYPTIAELAKVALPATVTSKSLVPVINGEKEQVRESAVFAYKNFQRAIKKDNWKLILYNVSGAYKTQLFNLHKDPWEKENLAEDRAYKTVVETLKTDLYRQLQTEGDSADFYKENWGVDEIPSWESKLKKRNPEVLKKLRKMAAEENDMVKNYWK